MQKMLTLILLSFFMFSCNKQDLTPTGTTVTTPQNTKITFGESKLLDSSLKEASGLAVDQQGKFWVNLDSGNDAELYQISNQGDIDKTISLSNVNNNDWEDLAFENDNLYVGDFGNNDNERTNLAIYKLENFSEVSISSYTAKKTSFSFEDQAAFPPSDAQMHFDIEGFIATSEYFYLFTKDRSDPFTGITKLYQLPNEEGTFEAKLLDVYTTGGNDKSGAITGATFNEDTSLLVLLSEQKLFLFRNFDIPNFFDGTVEIVDLPYERKFEGISFADDCTLLLVNEKKYGEDAQLLEISICD